MFLYLPSLPQFNRVRHTNPCKIRRVNVTRVLFVGSKAMTYLPLMAAPCLDGFTIIRGIGDGSSGTVYLVRENDTCGLYALKVIQKRERCRPELEIETVMAERNALLDLRGDDFILQLCACFHDSRNYYLLTVRDVLLSSMKTRDVLTINGRNTTLPEISTPC